MACNEYGNFFSAPVSEIQTHVHEYECSTRIAEPLSDPHEHRFAGTTGEVIPMGCNNHRHRLLTNTDYYNNHLHIVSEETGPCVCVGHGKHVHAVAGIITASDGHTHEFVCATMIENPTGKCV